MQSIFPDTRWSIVVEAQGGDTARERALAELCQSYWYPLYAHARRKGLSPHDAEDRTQGFFQHLLHKEVLASVSREKGKFRAFLLVSLNNFLAKQWRGENTQKRGGNVPHLSIDLGVAEQQFADDSADNTQLDILFDRGWAHALLQSVFARMEEHYRRADKWDIYLAIRPALQGDGSYGEGKDIASRFGISPEGVRSAVFKMRRRFREYVEEEIRDTCARPEDAVDEIRYLCKILSSD